MEHEPSRTCNTYILVAKNGFRPHLSAPSRRHLALHRGTSQILRQHPFRETFGAPILPAKVAYDSSARRKLPKQIIIALKGSFSEISALNAEPSSLSKRNFGDASKASFFSDPELAVVVPSPSHQTAHVVLGTSQFRRLSPSRTPPTLSSHACYILRLACSIVPPTNYPGKVQEASLGRCSSVATMACVAVHRRSYEASEAKGSLSSQRAEASRFVSSSCNCLQRDQWLEQGAQCLWMAETWCK